MQDKTDVLAELPLLQGLSDRDMSRIATTARFVEHEAGTVICRQGDTGRDVFILISGSVLVQQGSRFLAKLGAGDVVGELAVLDDQPRSADVYANSHGSAGSSTAASHPSRMPTEPAPRAPAARPENQRPKNY